MRDSVLKNAMGGIVFATISATGAAQANTVTFEKLPDYFDVLDAGVTGSPYIENGVTVASTTPGGVLASYLTPGAAHIDDSGTDFTSGLMFTMATAFDAIGFTMTSLGYDFLDTPGPLSDNILVTGFSGGASVASVGYTLSDIFGEKKKVTLGAGFTALDALLIEIIYPNNIAACGAPCGHFDLNKVVLSANSELRVEAQEAAAVPLPASALLLGAAGLALFGFRRKSRA